MTQPVVCASCSWSETQPIHLYLGLLSISFGIKPNWRQQEEGGSVCSGWRFTTVGVPLCGPPRHTNHPNHHRHRARTLQGDG